MEELNAPDFMGFFQAVHGREPFDWQKRLADQVLEGQGWPDVIRVPTGCGKTSTLDLALFELAAHALKPPAERIVARRICFVIDRRLVVDEVTEHAGRLHDAIRSAALGRRAEPVLKAVAERLSLLSADSEEPLRVVRLRGGVYRDDGWAADPLTPAILISTVDQIGSRLLFRGYGVGRRSRAVHAGLLAFDTRIILDEAHLSTVFGETLDRARQYQQWAEHSPLPENRFTRLVRMSATAGGCTRVFDLKAEERKDERLRPRLEANKRAELIEVKVEAISKETWQKQPQKAREQERRNREVFVQATVQQAKHLAGFDVESTGDQANLPRVIGVVVNRVATAREVFEQLGQTGADVPPRDVILLTGRIRPYDRDRLLDEWLPRIKVGREKEPERALFIVATQTVEVGANLDFDALVTETAPLDALRQRFGRLDRLGSRHQRGLASPAAILIRSDNKNKSDDPIYGKAIAETWKWLTRKDVRDRPREINFGVNLLDPKVEKLTPELLSEMLAQPPDAPVLLPAHLDTWVQTNPTPDPDADVAPFLHGQADSAADVQIVWRADLNESDPKAWKGVIRRMPPRVREALSLPLYELRAWLRRAAWGNVSDVEGARSSTREDRKRTGRRVLCLSGTKNVRVVRPEKIKPGDTVVVPATYGGCDKFGWKPTSLAPVTDIAEPCLTQLITSYPPGAYRRPKFRLRLHPSLLETLQLDPSVRQKLVGLLEAALVVVTAAEADPWPATRRLLGALLEQVGEPTHRAPIATLLEAKHHPRVEAYGRDGLLLIEEGARDEVVELLKAKLAPGDQVRSEDLEYEEPEDDEPSPGQRQVLLTEHTRHVEEKVAIFADGCGLDGNLKKVLAEAARWHDEGKRDWRFQAWLHGSELKALAELAADRPLAKSGRNLDRWGRSDSFGYPRGGRHEFVSVRLFEQAQRHEADSPSRDLARLLIGTHHGYGRAFPPVLPRREQRCPVDVLMTHGEKRVSVKSDHRFYRLDSDWVDLFWRMVHRYGWWGLAYLEALLVTADHSASAQEQRPPASQTEEPAA